MAAVAQEGSGRKSEGKVVISVSRRTFYGYDPSKMRQIRGEGEAAVSRAQLSMTAGRDERGAVDFEQTCAYTVP
ncbi:hypothetical protein NQZ68_032965 [Dissostichus eleginoides]|nr:hypothetical protein NQZ68_032965 [Dissostichus eleginoides]